MSINSPDSNASPRWGSTPKLIAGLTLVGFIAVLLAQFRNLIGPFILAVMLAYLLHPVAARFSKLTHLPWRASVTIIYLILAILLIGLSTMAGLAIVQQIQSLVGVVEKFLTDLPNLVNEISSASYQFGPFQFNLSGFNLQAVTAQLLPNLQSLLGRVGGLVSSLASGAVATVGWLAFELIIVYFLLVESDQMSGDLIQVEIPGYSYDLSRLSMGLRRIWNAYVRGQLLIIGLTILASSVLMSIVGVRYALGIAILAGVARFVPYVGPLITDITIALVAIFQGYNHFGLEPVYFAILAVVAAIILDQIMDNMVSPRLMSDSLGVHPAAVLIAALVAANLLGVIGLVLAAPVLATLILVVRYLVRKMFDLDPWAYTERQRTPPGVPGLRLLRQLRLWWGRRRNPLGNNPPRS
jgi:predicted PurR-regulated permease PerM